MKGNRLFYQNPSIEQENEKEGNHYIKSKRGWIIPNPSRLGPQWSQVIRGRKQNQQ